MTIINSVIKGKQPVIDTLNVTPTTSAQQITATGGTDGYSPVNVSAVTSSIDANIVAGNIKKDVQILGVTGSYEGTTPTGTVNITSNGTHNVSSYEYAEVLVPTTAPSRYLEFSVDANGKLIHDPTVSSIINLNGATDVGDYVLCLAYSQNTSLVGNLDLSSLTKMSGPYAMRTTFSNCTGITSVDLSGITIVSGESAFFQTFYECSGITSVDLSSLETVSGRSACSNMFYNCSSITNINISSLTTSSAITSTQTMFAGTGIATAILSSLKTVIGQSCCGNMFDNCSNLLTLYFPALKNLGSRTDQFNNMLKNTTGVTVHFPSNMQSVMGSWTSVTGGFGGTNTTVLFDLPATNILTGADTVEYERNPKYDTATALAWRVNGSSVLTATPYYTSGLTDPTVGTTIYSDSACTIAETTVDSIA